MKSDVIIQVDHLSKQYRLGEVSTGTLAHDLNRWWHHVRGKEDPYLKVTRANIRDQKAEKLKYGNAEMAAGQTKGGDSKISAFQRFGISDFSSDYVWALRDVSFEVKRGEVLGIIGRNGAGKSTLLKILSRITAPTRGEVRIDGRIAALLEVGTGFHQDLTGRENIYLNGAILGMTKAEIRGKLDEIVEFSGCAAYLDTPVKRYSSGMVVRLGFAVAAHLEPEILIVDEVLAVGDAEFQQKCIGKMQDVAGHGRTVLFVSHNMGSIQALCRNCLRLDAGAIVDAGAADEVVSGYLRGLANAGQVSLVERTDREGDGSVRATGVWFQDVKGVRVEAVGAGQPIDIYVHYESRQPVGAVVVNMKFYDAQGAAVGYLSTACEPPRGGTPPEATLRCRIPALPLVPGSYRLNLSVWNGTTRTDRIEGAAFLAVHESNFYSTGRMPPLNNGPVLMPYVWEVVS